MVFVLLFIVFLIGVNGFFAASEMALVSLSKADLHQLDKTHKKQAKILRKIKGNSVKYLSTIQVAITFAGFLSSAFAGSKLGLSLVNFLGGMGINLSLEIAVVIITVILSYFSLVLGELVPKKIALQYPKKFSLIASYVVFVTMKMTTPFVWLLTVSTNGVLKVLGIKMKPDSSRISETEIKELILYGHLEGLYNQDEKEMLEHIFRFDDITVKMIMTPKDKLEMLSADTSLKEAYDLIIQSGYSRVPIFDKDKDNVIGVLLTKDLMKAYKEKDVNKTVVEDIVHDAYFSFSYVKINYLFQRLRTQKQHMAIIVNEANEFLGVVTLEDILEELVGEIYDEHDYIEDGFININSFTYLINKDKPIKEVNKLLQIKLPYTDKPLKYLLDKNGSDMYHLTEDSDQFLKLVVKK
ncbi:MAG: hemolysin family protein [Candidatus Izimaplasma sp.]|nr:hemolysin family protein [Candidatus Izimaplasma bacterium]